MEEDSLVPHAVVPCLGSTLKYLLSIIGPSVRR